MLDNIVERVALALYEYETREARALFPDCNAVGEDGWSVLMSEVGKNAYRAKARAAIEAMREPTKAMLDAGMIHCGVDLASEYRAMIGAALQTKKAGDRA